MTHRNTWKARERAAARMFGTSRQRCSGSSGLADETRSDSKHPRLYLENKLREKHTAVTLWDDTHAKAAKEKKTAVVVLAEKGRPGVWILVRSTDAENVVVEWLACQDAETLERIEARVRQLKIQEVKEGP
jgi:hypothetical protein